MLLSASHPSHDLELNCSGFNKWNVCFLQWVSSDDTILYLHLNAVITATNHFPPLPPFFNIAGCLCLTKYLWCHFYFTINSHGQFTWDQDLTCPLWSLVSPCSVLEHFKPSSCVAQVLTAAEVTAVALLRTCQAAQPAEPQPQR